MVAYFSGLGKIDGVVKNLFFCAVAGSPVLAIPYVCHCGLDTPTACGPAFSEFVFAG